MGCTGSKYQALSAGHAQGGPVDDKPSAALRPGLDHAAVTPDAKAPGAVTPPAGHTAGGDASSSTLEASATTQPSGSSGTRDGSAMPDSEPPLAETLGDVDAIDMEVVSSENLEEQFPPWKENDKIRPTSSLNKFEEVLKPCNQTPPSLGSVGLSPDDPEAWESLTNPDNTVIIFDWDDTLLCSSALHCCLPNQFSELEEVVEAMLHLSMSLGRTIIVTNAMESWITETARRFMPRLIPTLERLPIVYARKNWERLWPGDTFAWKRECFREIMHDQLGQHMNLIVLGDSLSEIRAAEALHHSLSSSALVKTVKFKALPTPQDLLGELRALSPRLAQLVEEKHSATKELCQDQAGPSMFQQTVFQGSCPWQMLDAVPYEMVTPRTGASAMLWSNQLTPLSIRASNLPTQITI